MYIENMSIYKFIPLVSFSQIKQMDINFINTIQLLLGDNGSGKTTLLNEIVPGTVSKHMYHKGGTKVTKISHEGHSFELGVEIEKNSGHYSFKKNSEELNISGGSKLQQELIEEHLGFTNLICSLVKFDKSIPHMTPSVRKTLLLQASQNDLSFILDYHKKICSEIRAIRSNVKLLLSQEIELTTKCISSDNFDKLKAEMQRLERVILSLEKLSTVYKSNLERIENLITQDHRDLDNFVWVLNELKSMQETYKDISYIGSIDTNIGETEAKVSTIDEKVNDYHQQAQELSKEIERIEKIIAEVDTDKINRLRQELNTLLQNKNNIEQVYNPKLSIVPVDLFDTMVSDINYINGMFDSLIETKHLYPTDFLNKVNSKYKQFSYEHSSLVGFVEKDSQELKVTQNKLQGIREVDLTDTCLQTCLLAKEHFKEVNELKTKIQQLNKNIIDYKKKINILRRKMKPLRNILEEGKSNIDLIRKWQSIITKYSVFISLTFNNVSLSFNAIKILYENSKLHYQLKNIEDQISKLQPKLELAELRAKDQVDQLITSKEKYEKELSKIVELGIKANEELTKLRHRKKGLHVFKEIDEKTIVLTKDFKHSKEQETLMLIVEAYNRLISKLDDIKSHATDKLFDIKQTLNEQEKIKDRLEHVVTPKLKELQNLLSEREQIEKAVSPTSGIPQMYIIHFLNQIIEMSNYFLDRIWSYEMNLVSLKEDQRVDFNFKIKVKNHIVNDISMCSDGQKAILNIVMTLSILIHMGILSKYPLFFDEADEHLDPHHRQKVLDLITELVQSNEVIQIFLINHYAALSSGLPNSDVLCLSKDNIVPPVGYNSHVKIKK